MQQEQEKEQQQQDLTAVTMWRAMIGGRLTEAAAQVPQLNQVSALKAHIALAVPSWSAMHEPLRARLNDLGLLPYVGRQLNTVMPSACRGNKIAYGSVAFYGVQIDTPGVGRVLKDAFPVVLTTAGTHVLVASPGAELAFVVQFSGLDLVANRTHLIHLSVRCGSPAAPQLIQSYAIPADQTLRPRAIFCVTALGSMLRVQPVQPGAEPESLGSSAAPEPRFQRLYITATLVSCSGYTLQKKVQQTRGEGAADLFQAAEGFNGKFFMGPGAQVGESTWKRSDGEGKTMLLQDHVAVCTAVFAPIAVDSKPHLELRERLDVCALMKRYDQLLGRRDSDGERAGKRAKTDENIAGTGTGTTPPTPTPPITTTPTPNTPPITTTPNTPTTTPTTTPTITIKTEIE